MKEQWKQDIQQKLADFQQPAPELSWDIIEEAVRQKRTTTMLSLKAQNNKKKKKKLNTLLILEHYLIS